MFIDKDSSGGALWSIKMSMEEQKGDIFINPIPWKNGDCSVALTNLAWLLVVNHKDVLKPAAFPMP